jgi:azurin
VTAKEMSLKTPSILILAALSCAARVALADECQLTIEANDLMQYNQKEMHVPSSCKNVQLTLVHTGKLAANVMGHNWVLTKTRDVVAIANDGLTAGLAHDFLKPADVRVLAATKVIGGGATTSMSFSTAALKVGEDYSYFCSAPGHYALMKGRFKFG